MNVLTTKLPGTMIIKPDLYGDKRGWFQEAWNRSKYADLGLDVSFVQDNLSFSRRGTLRGLHYQNPKPQGKLVSVLLGEVYDVAVDVRANSETFGQWFGVTLSSENRRQFYVPLGFAHRFCVTSDTALFAYKCTELYNPATEGSILWNDPDLGIDWPLADVVVSEKDRRASELKEISLDRFLFNDSSLIRAHELLASHRMEFTE